MIMLRKILLLICLLLISIVFSACNVNTKDTSEKASERSNVNIDDASEKTSERININIDDASEKTSERINVNTEDTSEKTSERIKIDDSLYKNDDNNSLKYLYVTIQKDQGDKNYTFSDLDKDTDKYDDYKPELEVLFQEGTENGPGNGYYGHGLTVSNATLRIRGSSTRNAVKKSFKIELNKNTDIWDGNEIINLNKHPYDNTKLRNKLSFDYFKKIPDLVTLRTQFVNLYIKDLNKPSPDKEFINYGLFTQIEEVDEDFLAKRGLDPNGNLYKANFFEFWLSEQMVNVDSPLYNKKEFERFLEIKAGKDHSKMLSMITDVMDENIDIDEVVDRYFNRDNYLTWLAVNIIMGNIDTGSQNYYLYSPENSTTWYFLPWDYDGAWGFYNQTGESSNPPPWQKGVNNYGGVVLTRRFLTKEANVAQLKSKVEELSNIITTDDTSEMLNGYFEAVKDILSEEPDKLDLSMVKKDIDKMITTPKKNIQDFYESLKTPMAVFTGNPVEIENNMMFFPWNESYCPSGEEISYSFTIARDLDFQNIILNVENIKETNYSFDKLVKGTYFFKLTINCTNGYSQVTFDTYIDENGTKHYGIRKVVID